MCDFNKHLTQKQIGIFRVALMFFNVVMMFSNAACVIYFGVQLTNSLDNSYIASYKQEVCTPVTSDVVPIFHNRWLSVWHDVYNRSMIIDPFTSKANRIAAVSETREIELGTNQSCMCRANGYTIVLLDEKQNWDTCIFNTVMIRYFQRDYNVHLRTNISFIATSAFALILSVITLPMSIRLYKESGSTYIELK